MPQAIIRHAVVSYSGEQKDANGNMVRTAQFASRGQAVELEQEEFDRLAAHGAIYSEEQSGRMQGNRIEEDGVIYNPASDPAGDANAPVGDLAEMDDEALQELVQTRGTPEIVALAQGLPVDVIERVLQAENVVTEGNPRPTLLGPLVDSLGYNPLTDQEEMDWKARRLGQPNSDANVTGHMSGAGEGARVFSSLDDPSPFADDLDPTRVPGGSLPLGMDRLPIPNGGGDNEEPVSGPTKAELQEEAEALGLSTSGNKAEIAARIADSRTDG